MEQRKGAGSLIALAAAAALGLSGCGGTSPKVGATSAARTSSSTTTAAQTASARSSTHTARSAAPAAQHAAKSRAHLSLPSGPPEPAVTPTQRAKAAIADIALTSPAIPHLEGLTGQLPFRYTCKGQNTPPPLRWRGIPTDAAELQLYVMSLRPVDDKLFFNWAVAGLNPKLTRLQPANLPAGAIVGRNGYGHTTYSICPQAGEREQYVFALFALPTRHPPKQGYNPLVLRKQIIGHTHSAGVLILASRPTDG